MTVRLIPTMSDSTPPPQVPSPPQSSDAMVTDQAVDAPDSSLPDPPDGAVRSESTPSDREVPADGVPPAADSRIALRDARRQRRRTAWLCAAIVALCLGLTIAVVSLARNRPAPFSGVVASSALPPGFTVLSTHAPGSTLLSSEPSPGASAPEGGNP